MKTIKINGREFQYSDSTNFLIQVGKGEKGAYATRYSFTGDLGKASFYYQCINIGNGYKKRLVMDNNGCKSLIVRALS
jgi:hypothetical protein